MNFGAIWIATVVSAVANISQPLKLAITKTVLELDAKAKSTPNPWDNVLVAMLAAVLGVDTTKEDGTKDVSIN